MTDTTKGTTGARVGAAAPRKSLFGGAAQANRGPVEQVAPPLTINLVTGAFIVMVVAMVGRALLLLGFTPQLQAYVKAANDKKPVKNFNVDNAVHSLRTGSLLQAAIFGVALLLLAYAVRRTRSASGSRWAVLIIFVYTMLPLYIIPTKGLPFATQVAGVVLGLGAIAVLLLIFFPKPSQQYFRDCREANTPPELRGQPRPGLASLFQKRPPRAGTPAAQRAESQRASARAGARPTVNRRPATTRTDNGDGVSMSKSKAKTRSDADAVARGAELARTRAKASKSRRTAQ